MLHSTSSVLTTNSYLQEFYPSDMGGFGAFMRRPPTGASMRRFDEYYRCYPIVMMSGPEREYANYGGKVFLPPSALEKLTRLHITYPMIFELINTNEGKTTHAGVLEFVAEEGRIYLPYWVSGSTAYAVQGYLLTMPLAHEDSLAGCRRPAPDQIHRPPARPICQTPTPISILPGHLRPSRRVGKCLPQLLLLDQRRYLHVQL